MGRLLRSSLKQLGVRRESYLFLVTCSSVLLYVVCLYSFMHLNNAAAKEEDRRIPRISQEEIAAKSRAGENFNWRLHFDDGKIHEFEKNVAAPVDWDLTVKKKGVDDIVGYLHKNRDKQETPTHLSNRSVRKNKHQRHLLSTSRASDDDNSTLQNNTAKPDPLFPADIFTKEQRQHGAVLLHIAGVTYMFVALAIVCDEFFVPSLEVIIEKMEIPDDVAGATFMAAGGSAPELFTSVIGVFVSFDDVGIGTIVGSAVFNILFVIGMCALFSKTVLTLTWWPLFRDCSFYSISLITLILFFTDNAIYWWEALLLLLIYAAYVSFMKWNETLEKAVKRFLYRNTMPRISSTDHLVTHSTRGPPSQISVSSNSGCGSAGNSSIYPPAGANGDSFRPGSAGMRGSKFRHGLLQLMMHSIDPMHDGGHVDDKANKLHAIASLRVLLDATKAQAQAQGQAELNLREAPSEMSGVPSDLTPVESIVPDGNEIQKVETGVALSDAVNAGGNPPQAEDAESNQALDLSWPQTTKKQITYVLLLPILLPLWLTLPDARTPRGKRYFVITFIGSIVWIAAFSYLMVWWANITGETVNIPPEVMGLTFLAAGTSIPDLITSVIVARKGFGDMAVSSSVGSNIFDVCVGLPLPWLLYGIIKGEPVQVSSSGMACSIMILFGMLLFVILSIACFRWKMNKPLGVTMFLFYFVFVALSLGFEYGYLVCPF